ncbi:unnamed protein product [Lymnaea stagnalis]|uniref:Carboxylesterase type B domain-containing protein n=1 Tax=Lymnaea stagnalis TaxID=6523 RepID=A0AAV2I888_LYMST
MTSLFKLGFSDRERESYFMLLDHMPTYTPQPFVGFYHALDLSYVFDLDPSDILKRYYRLDAARGYTEEEMEMRRVYQSIVVDFMTTGNPGLGLNRNMTSAWRPFDPDNEYFLSLTHRPSVQQFPLEDRRAFWTKTFPEVVEAFRVQDLLKDEL